MTARDRLASLEPGEIRGLDPGIVAAVRVLRRSGIETYESCEGGPGHSYPEPAVRFHGQRYEGYRALSAALLGSDEIGLRLYALRRFWTIEDGEAVGPRWELVWLRASRA
jgi:hypothetical protein